MKSQKKMWQEINEPKVERTGFLFRKDGTPWLKYQIVDRVPRIRRERKCKK